MAQRNEWLAQLFEESASRKLMATFSLALLPLLAEAALTFTICRAYLLKRPPASAIPSSIKSILFINLVLTLLLLCATLSEGAIVSVKLAPDDYSYWSVYSARLATISLAPTTPSISWSAKEKLDLLAMALMWMVVVAYVGVVAHIGLRVASCGGEGMGEKSSWSFKAMQRMMQMADRSKWVALYFAIVFSTWTCLSGTVSARSMSIWEYPYVQAHGWDSAKVLAMLWESVQSERVWRWTAASSMLILLGLVSLYTIAARVALFACCKHFSLQQQAEPLISMA